MDGSIEGSQLVWYAADGTKPAEAASRSCALTAPAVDAYSVHVCLHVGAARCVHVRHASPADAWLAKPTAGDVN
jgi:methylaspartate ammonia-lyase